MQYLSLLAIVGAATAQGVSKGFNYGNAFTDGSWKQQADFAAEFTRAQDLPNTSGFSSARLYTMIQGGTANTPISAIQAAIDTDTSLLLGLWASAGNEVFQNELVALSSAIEQYGSAFTDLIVGISVGSEDLYRTSVQGVENDSGRGESPEVLVDYIQRTRSAIAGTAASTATIGHVDTWNDWVNGSNNAVLDAVDWIGFNAFPYFENTLDNSVDNGNSLFFSALNRVEDVSQGKPVWITEAGWPVSGPTENQAVPSVENSKTYWDELGCEIFNNYNVWWYILRDNNAAPAPSPSFGIVGIDLGEPLFDLTCPAGSSGASASAVPATSNGTASASETPVTNDSVVSEGSTEDETATSNGTASTSSDPAASDDSTKKENATSQETDLDCAEPETGSAEVKNTTQSSPPASHSSQSTSSIFSDDMPEILKSLPAIVAANPSIVKKLPSLLAANPDLIKKVEGVDFDKMAAEYNVPPIYVTMVQDAIENAKKGDTADIVKDAKTIAQILRDGDEA